MSAPFDLNWMTSSFIMLHNYLCKLNFEIENYNFLTKFVLISSFRLIIFPSEAANTCFLLISVKNKILEKSKMAAKMADML